MPESDAVPNERFREARIRLFGSRQSLADAVNQLVPDAYRISDNDIGKIERGQVTWPRRPRRDAYRQTLQAATDQDLGFFDRREQQPGAGQSLTRHAAENLALLTQHRVPTSTGAVPKQVVNQRLDGEILRRAPWEIALTETQGGRLSADATTHVLATPAGRALPGLEIPAQLHPAVHNDKIVVQIPAGYAADPFLHRPGRALVVGQTLADDPGAYLLDSRHARRMLRGAPPDARLIVPSAYRLDELTYALLWAVANFDAELLADDAALAAGLRDAASYIALRRSAASRDIAADLSPASFMWLGSQFCADHILRHASDLTSPPLFWTREQSGEQAAAWLLFTHKHDYLRATATTGGGATRVFCVPEAAVISSPAGERALLLLAVALMESHGITTTTTDTAELAAIPGFVLDPENTAITATWIGADGIWYVDVTDNHGTLREYTDAAGHAAHHSVTAAPTPALRLRHLADYLDLDWAWLSVRCRELGAAGTSGIAQPRSRLLSLDGVDRACRFVAACAGDRD
ncbi:hypothetical protein OHA21_38600 [Actinoplanes sp. NBC_00393]|uniref:hypothetical protein n=1 Tax=Actinoplanes sp. NBC_00393 TaxID=2975953 RepID=UPI002E1BA6CA